MTQANTGFNLDNLDANDASQTTFNVAVIVDEDGNDKSGFIIVGKNSQQYQDAAQAVRIAGFKKSAKRQTALDATTDDGAAVLARLVADNEKALALSVVVDWFGFDSNGSVAVFDKTVVAKLFAKFPTWQAKVSAALEIDKNFIKG